MAKRNTTDSKVNRVRNLIIVGVAVLVGAVVSYGVLYSEGVTDIISTGGKYSEGEHYTLLPDVAPRRPGSAVKVTEYFSYGCIHCKNFEPLIKAFAADLPEGAEFERAPATFSPAWALLGQAYLALESLDALEPNHLRLFRAIHESGRQFLSADMLGDFVDGKGVTKAEFLRAFNSPSVRRALAQFDAASRSLQISSVPSLVVDGRYRVNMDVGRKQSLEVARYLLELAKKG